MPRSLRDALVRYTNIARRPGGGARRPALGGRRSSVSSLNSAEVSDRAKAQGIELKNRGRVTAEVVAGFKPAIGK
jgi:hypothetical protein